MTSLRELSKRIITNPKSKYWLCAAGVIIIMSVLATMPPISKNNIAGTKPATAAREINGGSLSLSSGQAYVQTASAAGQGSASAVQGTPPASQPTFTQDTLTPQPVMAPPIIPIHLPCYVCGGPHLMCPDVATGCSRCLGPLNYACLIEE